MASNNKNKVTENSSSRTVKVNDADIVALFSKPVASNEPKNKQNQSQQKNHNHNSKPLKNEPNKNLNHVKRHNGNNLENQAEKPHEAINTISNQKKAKELEISIPDSNSIVKSNKSEIVQQEQEENPAKASEESKPKKSESLSKLMNFMEDDLTDNYEKVLEEKIQNDSESKNIQDELNSNNSVFSICPQEDCDRNKTNKAEKDEENREKTIGQVDKSISETKISSLESETLNKLNKEFVSKTRRTATLFENLIELLDSNYPDKMTVNEIFRAIISCEQALRDNRSFAIYCSEMVKKELQKGELADEEAFKVSYENIYEDIYYHEINSKYAYFRLPELATKRNFRNNIPERIADFSNRNYIQNALREYQNKNLMPLWNEFTFVFIHYFDENNKWIRDTDNYNTKTIIDAFLDLLIVDDTSKCSHIVQLTMPVNYESFTEVYVLKGHYLGKMILKYLPRLSEKYSGDRSAK